jgi:hypothetical protein
MFGPHRSRSVPTSRCAKSCTQRVRTGCGLISTDLRRLVAAPIRSPVADVQHLSGPSRSINHNTDSPHACQVCASAVLERRMQLTRKSGLRSRVSRGGHIRGLWQGATSSHRPCDRCRADAPGLRSRLSPEAAGRFRETVAASGTPPASALPRAKSPSRLDPRTDAGWDSWHRVSVERTA